jgi:hypothetical protein
MKNPPVPVPETADHTEAWPQALIAECRQIIREVVAPSAEAADDVGRASVAS